MEDNFLYSSCSIDHHIPWTRGWVPKIKCLLLVSPRSFMVDKLDTPPNNEGWLAASIIVLQKYKSKK